MKYPLLFKNLQMANAATTPAPETKEKKTISLQFGDTVEEVFKKSNEHLVLSQEFDPLKKYMFELAVELPERENPVIDMRSKRAVPHKKFQPFRNLVLTSQIVWKGSRRMVRYYDGCTSIFTDKQPKDKEVIDQLIKQSTKREFLDGKFGVYGDDKMLLLYLNICSWNVESPFRTRTADGIFRSVNGDKIATIEADKLDQTEKALELAKGVSKTKMFIHAAFLGIPVVDWDSGNDLTEKEIRTAYRREALRNSDKFIESYGNKSIETQYFIDKALREGIISNKFNPNKATWSTSNREICDISGLKSNEAISQRLFEFSQTEEGAEFGIQLKAISES